MKYVISMILECRNTHYNKISQILNDLLEEFNIKVSTGSNCECLQSKLILFNEVKSILSCYKPYLTDLTYLYSLSITRGNLNSVTIDLDIGSDTFSYTGIETASAILINLRDQLNASGVYLGYINGGVLYIYSYKISVDFNETTTFTSSLTTTIGTLTNLEDNPNILVNLWNCLTTTEICHLVNQVYELQPTC
jgi:hypothetical protein